MQVRKNKHMLSMQKKEVVWSYLFVLPGILGIAVFWIGPIAFSAILSLYKADMLTSPKYLGFENYANLFVDPLFLKSILNTCYYTFASVPLSMIVSLILALIANQSIRGIKYFRMAYYFPCILPVVATSLLWLWMLHPDSGIINYLLIKLRFSPLGWLRSEAWAMPALILLNIWYAGTNMVIYLAGLQGIPDQLYEAAELDGAGRMRQFFGVTLPLLSPTILFTLVMGLVWSFQVFTQAYVMTGGGPNNATLTYALYIYRCAFEQFKMGYASALAWIFFLIILTLIYFVFKSSSKWVYYRGV